MEIIAILIALFGVVAYFNTSRTRKRLNKIERMLAWKGVLTLDETLDENLPEEVRRDLRDWNR